jgi:hypothetical protein
MTIHRGVVGEHEANLKWGQKSSLAGFLLLGGDKFCDWNYSAR